MKKEYDLGSMKSRPNPYSKQLKKQITLRLGLNVLDYFKKLAKETGVPYQSLINFYLLDCVNSKKTLNINWE